MNDEAGERVKMSATDVTILEDPQDEQYKLPEKKSVMEILSADSGDEALARYKETLLGAAAAPTSGDGAPFIFDSGDERVVVPMKLELLVDGAVRDEIDLTKLGGSGGDELSLRLKEGATYQLRLSFYVQREIVSGLKYIYKVSRKGIPVESDRCMLGSYPPRPALQHYSTPADTAPSGMIGRGKYKVKSRLVDDDKQEFLAWTWHLEVVKEW